MISCDPQALLAAAAPYRRIPKGMQLAVISYLLAVWAGGSMDPNELMQQARCFDKCVPPGFQTSLQSFLLSQINGGSTDPNVLLQDAKDMGRIRGFENEVIIYLICQIVNSL